MQWWGDTRGLVLAALTKETLLDGNYWHNLALTHKQSTKSWFELSAPSVQEYKRV